MKKTKLKIEFSKLVLSFVMVLFFIVSIFGMGLISSMIYMAFKFQAFSYFSSIATALGALFTFVGAPTSVSIGYYLWKSKNENINKYGQITKEMINNLEGADNHD